MSINRRVYQLFLKEGWNIELVVPQKLNFPAGIMNANPPEVSDPPIHYLPLRGNNPRTYFFKGLPALMRDKKPSVVVLDNDPVSFLAKETGSWCQKNNAKLFCISNENMPLGVLDAIKRKGLKSFPASLIKRVILNRNRSLVNGIFAINSDGKKIFEKERFPNVHQMPLGFDPSVFYHEPLVRATIRQKEGLHSSVIAYFGRMVVEKGIHILIHALQKLRHLDWQFMIDSFDEYASGYHIEMKKQIDNAGIADRLVYIHPDHFQIAAYMNAADVVVIPSITKPYWKEQYGRVAAEAMACGKTVIASDSGALPELLNGKGLVFPEGNAEALARLLEQFLLGKFQQNSSEDIAAYARQELSINKQKAVMEQAFHSQPKNRVKTIVS